MAQTSSKRKAPDTMETEEEHTTFDMLKRNKELVKILKLTDFIMQKFFSTEEYNILTNSNEINLDKSNAIAGVLATVFVHCRKMANPVETARGRTYADMNATIGTISFTISSIRSEYQTLQGYEDFDYMVATPLVDMLTAFKMSYDEVRLSGAKFFTRGLNKPEARKITDFGLKNTHLSLLTGVTYKPERRAGLMRTLGPMTTALMLAGETRYHDKMAKALKESIRMLPMCDSVIDCLKEMRSISEGIGLYSALGDVLLLIGCRSTNKFYFPLLFVYKCFRLSKSEGFNFSGTSALLWYQKNSRDFIWKKNTSANAHELSQIIFHAMFGTAVEDLSILRQITDLNHWQTRKELNKVFVSCEKDLVQVFTPVHFKYISKAASANMMKNTGTLQPMLSNKIVFSGFRKKNYTSAFLAYLESGNNVPAFGKDKASLIYALTQLKMSYIKSVKEGEMKEAGTTKWFKIEGGELVPTEFVANESTELFYS
ncbi:MAG: nucleocapsid protein [Bactrocera correcta Orthomyxo-like virus]|nr:MAG: nucleocapsid protein [Bactrocera correcta Orthomyxo-like virus]